MKFSVLKELNESKDRAQWIDIIGDLRESYRPMGGMTFAKITGFHLRAQRLLKVESEFEVAPLDSWDTIYHDLEKLLKEASDK